MDVTATAALAAVVQQSQTQQQVGIALLRNDLQVQRDTVSTLLGGSGGGMVTADRGQNLNVTA